MTESSLPQAACGAAKASEPVEFPATKGIEEAAQRLEELRRGAPRSGVAPAAGKGLPATGLNPILPTQGRAATHRVPNQSSRSGLSPSDTVMRLLEELRRGSRPSEVAPAAGKDRPVIGTDAVQPAQGRAATDRVAEQSPRSGPSRSEIVMHLLEELGRGARRSGAAPAPGRDPPTTGTDAVPLAEGRAATNHVREPLPASGPPKSATAKHILEQEELDRGAPRSEGPPPAGSEVPATEEDVVQPAEARAAADSPPGPSPVPGPPQSEPAVHLLEEASQMLAELDRAATPPKVAPAAGRERSATETHANQVAQTRAATNREERPSPASAPPQSPEADNQLVQVRLGIASSLFAALRCRSAASASHSVRVALSCSAWALKLNLAPGERDAIEVAALLHDVGMIGVPDSVLLKPGPLTRDEMILIEQGRRMSMEILRFACAEPKILQIVESVGAWFDGSKGGYRHAGRQLPAGSRMIAILDAFDSMTTDQVFRRAMSQERAMQELFESAGTQFDPALVQEFADFRVCDQRALRAEVAKRWLHDLDPEVANSYWELIALPHPSPDGDAARRFETKLLENMHDAVMFIDAGMRIVEWNRGAERLTGIATASVVQRLWTPSVLNMQNEKGEWLAEQDCPVRCAIQSQVQSLRRLTIAGRGGQPISVDSHAIPVTSADGGALGAVLLMHDASGEASLEERCQTLYEKATKDPLTQVANRAEFDRVHGMFIRAHKEYHVACSLIICDLDHFKRVNDTYGHQAGDEVIQALANVLKNACRPGDLVARYGGEEFVMLCADCDNATAARRAEQARKALSQVRHAGLGGQTATASFGVTEFQPGATPETMLRRADRALLMAKEQGRNVVVQLGVGPEQLEPRSPASEARADSLVFLEQYLVTPVPLWVAVEKLRGFMADHRAKVIQVEENRVQLSVKVHPPKRARRVSDRPMVFRVDIRLEEEVIGKEAANLDGQATWVQTRLCVTVSPEKDHERRREEIAYRAKELLVSFRSYLMANEAEP